MKRFKCQLIESPEPRFLYLDKGEFKIDSLKNIKWRKHIFNESEVNWLKLNFIDFSLFYKVIEI